MKTLVATAILGCIAAPALAVNVNWADWQSTSAGGQVSGVMMVDGTSVGVSYSNSASSIAGAQVSGGIDYWQNGGSGRDAATSGYTSIGPDGNENIPTGTDIIRANAAATHTFTFLTAVQDLYLSFVSINGNSLTFNTPISVLSLAGRNVDGNGTDSGGFWGTGSAVVTSSGTSYTMTAGGEAHGTLLAPGTFTSFSFTTSASENWHGFTIGTAGVPAAVPLPAAGLLLLGGLGAVAGLRRRR